MKREATTKRGTAGGSSVHQNPTGGQYPTSSAAGAADRTAKVKDVTQVQVNAARLRLVTDRKQGKTSPSWVQRLANARRR